MKTSTTAPVVLITGAAGLLGRALRHELCREGSLLRPAELRLLDLHPPDSPQALSGEPPTRWIQADIRDAEALARACEGVDLVFHGAALIDLGDHPPALVSAINVEGTEKVIAACRDAGVRALVHTSSEDAVYGGEPIAGADETLPYPERFPTPYCETKALGEQRVLAAHDPEGLRCAVMRPVGIYGGGDPYHISSLLKAATFGLLPRMGDGSARFSHVYAGNVAHAHVLAGRALLSETEHQAAGGEVFFVTDSPPANFFDFYEPILRDLGVRLLPWALSLPYRPLRLAGAATELLAKLLAPIHRPALSLSRFAVDLICQDFYFDGYKLRERLGYAPRYSAQVAHDATVAHFRSHGPSLRRRLA